MKKKDHIVLDAEIKAVLQVGIFDAELCNGHEFIAIAKNDSTRETLETGRRVKVEFSTFDMSKGRIIGE